MIVYRTLQASDIPSGLSFCRAHGWNQLSRDWELFLAMSPNGCRVGVDDTGNIAGTVTTMRYGERLSWIGMLLVDPKRQRQGIGSQLLMESLRVLEGDRLIKLDATPDGRQVYLQYGFVDEFRLSRMMIEPALDAQTLNSRARVTTVADMKLIAEMDSNIFGANRKALLDHLREAMPSCAFVVAENGKLKGYCFARGGYLFTQLGPVIADNSETARQLVCAALGVVRGKLIMDVREQATEWKAMIQSMGFQEQRQLIRMYKGAGPGAGIPENQFAIAGPEFG